MLSNDKPELTKASKPSTLEKSAKLGQKGFSKGLSGNLNGRPKVVADPGLRSAASCSHRQFYIRTVKLLRRLKPDPCPAAVRFDELDAGCIKG